MRVSMKWLKELLPTPLLDEIPLVDLLSRLDMSGTAVEGYEITGTELPGVVIGSILTKVAHPEADKLWVCQVDVGDAEPVQIVCGAQNFEAGDKVPVATVGAVLPGDFIIKKAKLRGEVSMGMNCSAKELGVGSGADGLMILPADAPVGVSFASWYGQSDTILDLEITPNRPDCLSMVGVAREIGAVLDVEPAPVPQSRPKEEECSIHDLVSVHVEDADLCPRYAARVIRGVKIGPSPEWLSARVEAAGARSLNNVVDVTNYILFELGQPLHAFDRGKLAKDAEGNVHVTVRRATEGEKLTTLDGIERTLTIENLVIADTAGASCLAGVMGGEHSEVEEDTVDIFLESAVFDSANISRTSRKLALISESSLRFERGVDKTNSIAALDRAAALIVQVAGGTVAAGYIDEYGRVHEEVVLTLHAEKLDGLLGIHIELSEAAAILSRLGFATENLGSKLRVVVPPYRLDVTREVDLVEEVLRMWGMERVEATLPAGRGRIGGLTREQKLHNRIGQTLRACGLNETMTYPFSDPLDLEKIEYSFEDDEQVVELHNPMSSEQAVLRPTLIAGLLDVVSSNQHHGVKNIALYEMGKQFKTASGRKTPKEREVALGILSGSWNEIEWNQPQSALDFFDAKGILENVARELCVDRMRFSQGARPWLQPGRSAEILLGKDSIGWIGEIHPLVAEKFEIENTVIAFEFDVAKFIKASKSSRDFVTPPRFPALELDIALIVDDEVSAQSIEHRIASLGKKSSLELVRLFDVYRGKGIETGKKSLAYKLAYRADDRTLTAEEVEKVHGKILERLEKETGATLRA
ncbi:MAG: phenylalanine--tRNA ligase subunit beta [Coriobacteriia bacterium]|nr:phenylalanine--tRNA ligase subunit beta [Coriobacteriia bacterium]